LDRKYHEKGFHYYFKIANLRKAYRYKIEYAVRLNKNTNSLSSKQEVSNFLDIMIDDELIDYISFDNNMVSYTEKKKFERCELFNFENKKSKNIQNILLVGPAADPYEIDFKDYEYIAFTKPLVNNDIKINDKKLIIFLNNQWSIGLKKQDTLEWVRKNKNALIFSPNKIDAKTEMNSFSDAIPMFFNASPMNLQRTITLLFYQYNVLELDIVGFDFMLSEVPYIKWYPTITTEYFGTFAKGFIHTNLYHDFLFNYMYVKKLKQQFGDKIQGSIDPYLEMSIGDVIDLFEKRMKALSV